MTNPLHKLDGEAVTRALATLLHASYADEAPTVEQRDAWRDAVAAARRENDARTRALPEIAELYEAAQPFTGASPSDDDLAATWTEDGRFLLTPLNHAQRRLSRALAALKEKLR